MCLLVIHTLFCKVVIQGLKGLYRDSYAVHVDNIKDMEKSAVIEYLRSLPEAALTLTLITLTR